ncbi:MAG: dTDP-4-dehydrorhamnose reductase [Bacteroides sp.]|nr:dTDP-4-dehydrorhamnose reductase [Bacteroides sp.]MCM1413112.1 dTDP-4-dehydrorhamnose reductase [Bacteroides sp.]MCM1472146.1 dTDP-4-dehydrorhamnose reductase [Bacteroides sp.]
MKILVTGANGQLGNEMKSVLEQRLPGITTYTDIADLDLTDAAAVEKMVEDGEFTHIINCAAYTAVDKAESDQTMCYRINVDAVQNLAKAACKTGAKVVHISTDYVFDGTNHRPYTEADKVNPTSAYGTSKRKGEMILLSYCPEAIIFRTAWLYSPYGNNFVKTMLRLGKEKSSLRVVCDQIGTPTYAADLAQAIFTVITSPQWTAGIYHFSNEGAISWYDFTKAIHRIAGIDSCKVTPILTEDYPTAAARPHYSVLDKSKIKRTYNIEIPYWEDSLKKCIDILQDSND